MWNQSGELIFVLSAPWGPWVHNWQLQGTRQGSEWASAVGLWGVTAHSLAMAFQCWPCSSRPFQSYLAHTPHS